MGDEFLKKMSHRKTTPPHRVYWTTCILWCLSVYTYVASEVGVLSYGRSSIVVPASLSSESAGEYCHSTFKADSHIVCRAHAVSLPCRAAKGLECVFPIWFTQCGRVWFTFAMACPCYAPTIPFVSRPHHSTAVERRPCCDVALRRTPWSEHGMGMPWQVWIIHGHTV